jgi:hypothetical protein
MTYKLEITCRSVANLDFDSESEAREWMDSWYRQDYRGLNWSTDEATEMVLTRGSLTLGVSYCDMQIRTFWSVVHSLLNRINKALSQ